MLCDDMSKLREQFMDMQEHQNLEYYQKRIDN